jgi:hypothetical protein
VATGFDQTGPAPRRVIRQSTTTVRNPSKYTSTSVAPSSSVTADTEPAARQQQLDPENLELPSFLRRR